MSLAIAIKTEGFSSPKPIEIAFINTSPAVDVRAQADDDAAKFYAESVDSLPPVLVVLDDDGNHWLADGNHRVKAHVLAGQSQVLCRIKKGSYLDAYKIACHANDTHGIRTTNEDKRRRVEVAIRSFSDLSNRMIAELCGVDHKTVARVRPEIEVGNFPTSKRAGKDGKHYPTTNGKPKQPESPSAPVPHLFDEDDRQHQAQVERSEPDPGPASELSEPSTPGTEDHNPPDLEDEPQKDALSQVSVPLFSCPECPKRFMGEVWHCWASTGGTGYCNAHNPTTADSCLACGATRVADQSISPPSVESVSLPARGVDKIGGLMDLDAAIRVILDLQPFNHTVLSQLSAAGRRRYIPMVKNLHELTGELLAFLQEV